MNAAATVAEIVVACESMAGLPYDGEPVDQLQHALSRRGSGPASTTRTTVS